MKNLQQQLDTIVENQKGKHLLLHSCCAPCSSYVLEYLAEHFYVTVLFYNPNILPESEYNLRLKEQKRLIQELKTDYPIKIIEGSYSPDVFLAAVDGLETEKEGGKRCCICYRLRLTEAALIAKEIGADYFTTTLSISPHKNAKILDSIALEVQQEYGVPRLPSDFKKRGGFQRSIELSKKHNLYRQDWCGCPFSKLERENYKKLQEEENG